MSWENSYYRAIIIVYTATGVEGKKYRTIKNDPHSVEKFLEDVPKQFPGAHHVNFYTKRNNPLTGKGVFVKQVVLSETGHL